MEGQRICQWCGKICDDTYCDYECACNHKDQLAAQTEALEDYFNRLTDWVKEQVKEQKEKQ